MGNELFRDGQVHNQIIYQRRDTKRWEWYVQLYDLQMLIFSSRLPWDADYMFGEVGVAIGYTEPMSWNWTLYQGAFNTDSYYHVMKYAVFGSSLQENLRNTFVRKLIVSATLILF